MRTLSARARLVYGLGCIAVGFYPIALSFGLFEAWEPVLHAPRWVIAGVGCVFVIAGFMILLAHHSKANDFLACVLFILFGLLGIWVSLFSSSEGFSGRIPFFSREANVIIARCLFGIGALISFSMSIWAFRRGTTKS